MKFEQILIAARKTTGNKDELYTHFKRRIEMLGFSCEEYQEAIKKLCEALDY